MPLPPFGSDYPVQIGTSDRSPPHLRVWVAGGKCVSCHAPSVAGVREIAVAVASSAGALSYSAALLVQEASRRLEVTFEPATVKLPALCRRRSATNPRAGDIVARVKYVAHLG